MDKNTSANGFKPEGLAMVAPTLQGVIDNGDLSGIVSLVWRKGAQGWKIVLDHTS